MRVPTALFNMAMGDGEPSQSAMRTGPYTYRQLQNYYHMVFDHVAMEQLLCSEPGERFVSHVQGVGLVGHGVGLALEWTLALSRL